MRLLTSITILCAIGLLACSTSKDTRKKTTRYSRDRISSEEIHDSNINSTYDNAYELIKNKRPQWFLRRGPQSFNNPPDTNPVVYLNENRYGDISTLSSITIENIKEIKFLRAEEAHLRFGINHTGGAILVTLLYNSPKQ